MGKGLLAKQGEDSSNGVHIAFAAGTGVLVFMDLVAHLIRKQCNLLSKEEKVVGDDFKLIFYVSFPSKVDGYALELLEQFDKFCKEKNCDCFRLMLRLSDGSGSIKGRWDANFIDNTLNEHEKNHGLDLKKIWVCGPPIMNVTWEERTN